MLALFDNILLFYFVEVELIRPMFMENQQSSSSDGLKNVQIEQTRIHIEQAIQRIKQFKIMNEQLPTAMIKQADDIIFVICGIVNLSKPVLTAANYG